MRSKRSNPSFQRTASGRPLKSNVRALALHRHYFGATSGASMDFDTIEKYVRQILTLEFNDRDHEIQTNTTKVKSEMNARGLVNSTITLTNLSAFFLAEFNARIDLIARN